MIENGFNFLWEHERVRVVPVSDMRSNLVWSGSPVGDAAEDSEGVPSVWQTGRDKFLTGYQTGEECVIFARHPLRNLEHARLAAEWLTRKSCCP